MRDRRVVDDLTIEELEQILLIRKRQARMDRLRQLEQVGRRAGGSPMEDSLEPAKEDDLGARIAFESFLYGGGATRSWKDRSLRDKLLLGVEFTAVIGLVGILVYAALALRDINQEAASAQAHDRADLPTPTATALITAVVLPGGHTPPTDPGGAQPNYDEVPERFRPIVEQAFSGPVIEPTAGPSAALRIRIPALNPPVDAPIVQGDGWEQLIKGVGQHLGTANPGERGNLVLSAHNDIFGEIFRHLDQLQEGDEIIISTQTRDYTYRVAYWQTVLPSEVSVMDASTDPIVTLISCYPYLINTERIIVIAELIN
jgi:sortase A